MEAGDTAHAFGVITTNRPRIGATTVSVKRLGLGAVTAGPRIGAVSVKRASIGTVIASRPTIGSVAVRRMGISSVSANTP